MDSALFFFNDTATPEIYTLSLHDALPISNSLDPPGSATRCSSLPLCRRKTSPDSGSTIPNPRTGPKKTCNSSTRQDRKSTRLNSSHSQISYAVFCLKKKNECHTHAMLDAA